MRFLSVILILASFNTFAQDLPWIDVEVGAEYKLNQDIIFESGNTISINSSVYINDIIGLDYINVSLYEVVVADCYDRSAIEDMVILSVPSGIQETLTGFQLSEGCMLEVFVENVDLAKNSVFIK